MEQYKVLKKKALDEFIRRLSAHDRVVAPVSRGYNNFSFREVANSEEIALHYIPTILPPKKYFMPQRENIVSYAISSGEWQPVLQYEKMVLFGVHTCDLAGIQCLNMVFSEKPKDINYIVRKNKIAIIGFECNGYCDEYASCKVVDNHLPNGGYDLFFTELEDSFMVHVNTLLGEQMVESTGVFTQAQAEHKKQLDAVRQRKRTIFKDEVNVDHPALKVLFDKAPGSAVWNDLDKRCVACGNCTNVCPTCYCFDISDEIQLDFNKGARARRWDSCQNEEFASVASGENFRKERGGRQRHRYMRKFKFPVEKFSRYFCTGCGRCTRTCMAKISLKETINTLAKEFM